MLADPVTGCQSAQSGFIPGPWPAISQRMQQAGAIYKIVDQDAWAAFQAERVFAGAAIDLADGYIHFSIADQLSETLALHFAGRDDLVLLEIPLTALAERDLRWEPARDSLFPHLYGTLTLADVARSWPLRRDGAGCHILPGELS